MTQKKVLAILGSPHLQGHVAMMLSHTIRVAEKKGYHVDRINLYETNISYCIGCRACLKTKECVQKDDLQKISTLLKECDMVILASPIYWANVPAIVKNLFDRLLGYAMEETKTTPRPLLKGKQYVLLTACHTPQPFAWLFGQTRYAIRSMKEFFKTAGMKPIAIKVCSNTAKNKELSSSLMRKLDRIF